MHIKTMRTNTMRAPKARALGRILVVAVALLGSAAYAAEEEKGGLGSDWAASRANTRC